MAILETKNIVKRFAGVLALNSVNFSCEKGKITGLLGANGSGKSTLSKIITGVYRADAGEIIYKGKAQAFANPAASKAAGISMVFQNLSLVEDLTVWQNIALGCERKKGLYLDDAWARKRAGEILAELWPALDMERLVYQLSPCEMQIVEIAKALISEPELLIMDEPTAALERAQVRSLFCYMRKLVAQGVAIVFTSHRMKEVMEICDNVIVFKNGVNVGKLDFAVDARDADAVVSMIASSDNVSKAERLKRDIAEEVMLSVEELCVKNRLFDLSFQLRKGEILGIGGLSGQGQEELVLALAGNYPNCRAKRICLKGKNLTPRRPSASIGENMYLVPGDRNAEGLMVNHTIYDNMIYPKLPRKGHPFVIPRKQYLKESRNAMDALSVKASSVHTQVSTLSGGNAQKIVIGKWLSSEIDVLLLADPAKGVDVGAKQDMYDFVRALTRDHETSVVLYASDTEELIEQCDRVLIMFEGRFVAELVGEHINEQEIYEATMNHKTVEQGTGT